MKPWAHDRAEVAAVRSYVAAHYQDKTDLEIAKHFGLTRLYVKTVRVRMKLNKNLDVLREIRDARKKPREQLAYHKRKYDKPLSIKQKINRGISLTVDEQEEYMRSQGYVF